MTQGGLRPGAGRKPHSAKSVTLTLRLDAGLAAWVAAEAERTGRTRARVVSEAVAAAAGRVLDVPPYSRRPLDPNA